jgi:hypothetical protein
MNDATLKELKTVVQLSVSPVRATFARKRRMREELLAHLMAIVDEETERLGDEQAAVERAKQRFGDPTELAAQLQQAVPRWDRCRAILENLGYRPSDAAWRLAARQFLVLVLIYALWLPLLLLANESLRYVRSVEAQRLLAVAMVGGVVVIALINVVLSVVLAPLLSKIGPALASKRRGPIVLAVLCGFVVLCALQLPVFLGAALLLVLMARQAGQQWRYHADWA